MNDNFKLKLESFKKNQNLSSMKSKDITKSAIFVEPITEEAEKKISQVFIISKQKSCLLKPGQKLSILIQRGETIDMIKKNRVELGKRDSLYNNQSPLTDHSILVQKYLSNLNKIPEKIARNNSQFSISQTNHYERFGQDGINEMINYSIDLIKQDPIINKIFQTITVGKHKDILNVIFSLSFGKKIYILDEHLVSIHQRLGITNTHFDHLKNAIIKTLLKFNISSEMIVKEAQQIELYRNLLISNEKDKLKKMKSLEQQQHITILADKISIQLKKDINLDVFFSKLTEEAKSIKLFRVISQILSVSQNNYTFENIKQIHSALGINYVHFAQFKMNIFKVLEEYGEYINFTKACEYTAKLDNYRFAILNQYQSVKDTINITIGFNEFTNMFVKTMEKDSRLKIYRKAIGQFRILHHAKLMLYYFMNQHLNGISKKNIGQLHCLKNNSMVDQDMFDAFTDCLSICLKSLNCSNESKQDMMEEWRQFERIILQRPTISKQLKREYKIELADLIDKININVKNIQDFQLFFKNSLTTIDYHNEFVFKCLFKDVCPFKKNEIKSFHQVFKISNDFFDQFKNAIIESLRHYSVNVEMYVEVNEILEYYRDSIVCEEELK